MKRVLQSKLVRILGTVLVAAVAIAVTVALTLWVLSLRDPHKLEQFQIWLEGLGPGAWFVLLLVQYVQIVIAFIPGGPIQIIAGAIFGPWGGLATCLLGTVLATFTVFYLVNRHGYKVIGLFIKQGDIRKYHFLNDPKRMEFLVVVLFLIPGTPKDVLTYLFALTPIRPGRFLLLSTVARLPAMLTSVLAGDSIVNGEWLQALICFIIISVISLVGLLIHRKIMAVYSRHRKTI